MDNLINKIDKKLRSGKNLKYCLEDLRFFNGSYLIEEAEFNEENYIRKVLFQNDLFEIILIGWDVNQKSPIHNHSSNGCIFKLLSGHIFETIYSTSYINKLETYSFCPGSCKYIDNNMYYHRIENKSENKAVSLHIYSPPNFKAEIYPNMDD